MNILFEKILRKKKNEIKREIKMLEYFSKKKKKDRFTKIISTVNFLIRKKKSKILFKSNHIEMKSSSVILIILL